MESDPVLTCHFPAVSIWLRRVGRISPVAQGFMTCTSEARTEAVAVLQVHKGNCQPKSDRKELQGRHALNRLGLVGETVEEGGEDTSSGAVEEGGLNGGNGALLKESGDSGEGSLLLGDVLLVGEGLCDGRG